MSNFRKRFFLARYKRDGSFAVMGRETGMGRIIEKTNDVFHAQRFHGPAGMMTTLGGHYESYEALECEAQIKIIGVNAFPPEKDVFGT